jgi:hypothetical protein
LMQPLVQRFPEERLIDLKLKTVHGVCSIIAWAHYILGLSVLFKNHSSDETKVYRFGSSTEEIVIDINLNQHPSITLLSTSDKGKLFTMKPEPDEEEIDATFKGPARGYGNRIFDKILGFEDGREKVSNEMALIATAFAICISRHLCIAHPLNGIKFEDHRNDDEAYADVENDAALRGAPSEREKFTLLEFEVLERRIHESAHMLFDNRKLKKKTIDEYVAKYEDRSLYHLEKAPHSISAVIEEWDKSKGDWPIICLAATHLSVLILAFAHVTDLEACSSFPMCERYSLLALSDLSANVAKWDGLSAIQIRDDVWFEVIALLIIGQTGAMNLQTTSLVSERGWSVYMSTFGDADPSHTGKYI